MWPLPPNVSRFTRFVTLLCFTATTFFGVGIVAAHLATMCIYWGNLDKLGDVGAVLIAYSCFVFKLVYAVIKESDFRDMLQHLREFWQVARNREEGGAIASVVHDARFFTVVFFYVTLIDATAFVGSAVLTTRRNHAVSNDSDYYHKLPFDVWYRVDSQVSPNYELLIAFQAVSIFVTLAGEVGMTGTMMALIMHVVAQFRLIGVRLKAIGRDVSRGCKFYHDSKLNAELRWVFQFLDRLLGPLILCEVLVRALQICLCGYCLVQRNTNYEKRTEFALLLVVSWLQIGLWCWAGEAVTRESTSIARVISRDIPWRTLPCAVQRDLGFVLSRAQRECTLTALKMQIVNLRKLTEVFNTSMSYLTLLRKLVD